MNPEPCDPKSVPSNSETHTDPLSRLTSAYNLFNHKSTRLAYTYVEPAVVSLLVTLMAINCHHTN